MSDYNPATKTVHIDVEKASPAFSALSSPTIGLGVTPASLGGTLAAGTLVPPSSELISITLNGMTQTAAVGTGSFSSSFATGALAAGLYPVSYSYPGDANFNAATGTGTLQIAYGTVALYDQTKASKSGSTIPIKVQAMNAAGANLSSAALVVQAFQVQQVSGTPYGAPADAGNANPDLNFRYDPSLGGLHLQPEDDGLRAGRLPAGIQGGHGPDCPHRAVPDTVGSEAGRPLVRGAAGRDRAVSAHRPSIFDNPFRRFVA